MRINRGKIQGFTLVELVVGAGLTGLLGLTVAQVAVLSKKGEVNYKLSTEFSGLKSELGAVFSDPAKCIKMLGDGVSHPRLVINPAVATTTAGITIYNFKTGATYLTTGTTYGNLKITSIDLDPITTKTTLLLNQQTQLFVKMRINATSTQSTQLYGKRLGDFLSVGLLIQGPGNQVIGCNSSQADMYVGISIPSCATNQIALISTDTFNRFTCRTF